MVDYYPWSKKVLHRNLSLHKENKLATLDMELTAKCTGANCIYCDSKPSVGNAMAGEFNWTTLSHILEEAFKHGLEWIYTCGLGEPLEDDSFFEILHFIKERNIQLSIFSNGVFIDSLGVAQELKEAGVNIILKMDTFQEDKFDEILGCSGIAAKIYKAMELLLKAGYGRKTEYTDLAFSIVPTKLSIESIPEVIDFAEKNGIFASIGELEQAGKVIISNLGTTLNLNDDDVSALRSCADKYADKKYMRPICPSIISGIHIDNLGRCIVDKETGLNCKWFLLKEPDIHVIGDIREDDIFDLFLKVKKYRKACFTANTDVIKRQSQLSFIFGGCGGNPSEIISLAGEVLD